MREIIIGAVAMGFATAGMFFLRFWRRTHDRLFAFFAVAFFVLSINRVGLAFFSDVHGDYLYWVRFVAFVIILLAVVDKNTVRRAREQ